MVLFIGLGHTSRCGKDTVANALVSSLGSQGVSAKKISWAWRMKQIAYELYSWAGVEAPEYYETKSGEQDREIKLTKLASPLFPEGPTVVQVWVAIGTPAFRESVYPHTWVDYVMEKDCGVDVVVIPDCRFLNELTRIKEKCGTTLRCVRPGFPGRDTVADRELRGKDVWDSTIGGHSVGELNYQAYKIATAIKQGTDIVQSCVAPDYWSRVYHKNLKEAGYAT